MSNKCIDENWAAEQCENKYSLFDQMQRYSLKCSIGENFNEPWNLFLLICIVVEERKTSKLQLQWCA